MAKEAAGPDDAPEDAPVKVDARNWTREAIESLWGADAGNVREHPVENADLRQRGDECGHHLYREKEAWGNLHVVAEFEVGSKLQALR